MTVTHLVQKLGRNDAKLIWRDSLLLVLLAFTVVIAASLHYLLPWLDGYLAANGTLPNAKYDTRLADHFPLIVGFFTLFQGGTISGAIFGFALLDEKENDTLTAMLVTPVPFRQYIGYRVALPTLLGVIIIAGMMWGIGLALVPWWQVLLLAAGGSLGAPIAALFYVTFAENKVQGFAMSKFISIAGWIILIAWFVDEPWQWLFGLFPPYWICKAHWMALGGDPFWWAALLLGVALHLAALAWFVRRFQRVAYG